jgi:hypothetical protein
LPPLPTEPETAREDRDRQQRAAAVNTALGEADAHAPALQDLPEWQRIQTVRGAVGHLFRVIRERAGEHFGRLMGDGRVADFVRRVSLRACERIAGWAQAGADRLRALDERGTDRREELPSAEALLRLGGAASAYRGPRRGDGGTPPANGGTVDIPAMRKMGEALNRPMPGRVSSAAARGRSATAKSAKSTTAKSKKSATDKSTKSATAKRGGKKAAPGSTEQPGHLRRGGAEQQPQSRKPNHR